MESEISIYERVDVILDTYKKDSLKSTTHIRQGKCIRGKVEDRSQPPKSWFTFLQNNDNKTKLFRFLSEDIVNPVDIDDKDVICAFRQYCFQY